MPQQQPGSYQGWLVFWGLNGSATARVISSPGFGLVLALRNASATARVILSAGFGLVLALLNASATARVRLSAGFG